MVYLIHFDRPYHHCRHYIGYCDDGHLEARLARHKSGDGAKLLRVVTQAGIDIEVARTWPDGDRALERRLKNQKKASRLCPICRARNKKEEPYGSHKSQPTGN